MQQGDWPSGGERRQSVVPLHEVEDIAKRAAKAAISDLFEILGVDIVTPEGRKHFRGNMDWLSDVRESSDRIKGHAVKVGVGVGVTGIIAGLWQAIKS